MIVARSNTCARTAMYTSKVPRARRNGTTVNPLMTPMVRPLGTFIGHQAKASAQFDARQRITAHPARAREHGQAVRVEYTLRLGPAVIGER